MVLGVGWKKKLSQVGGRPDQQRRACGEHTTCDRREPRRRPREGSERRETGLAKTRLNTSRRGACEVPRRAVALKTASSRRARFRLIVESDCESRGARGVAAGCCEARALTAVSRPEASSLPQQVEHKLK